MEKKKRGEEEKREGRHSRIPDFPSICFLALREGGWDLAASERRKWWRNAKCKERKEGVKNKTPDFFSLIMSGRKRRLEFTNVCRGYEEH